MLTLRRVVRGASLVVTGVAACSLATPSGVVRPESGWSSVALPMNTESYDRIRDNPFLAARDNPLSTFSVDVDTASYANVRRFLDEGRRPPADAVRIEELVNYFRYAYPPPAPGGEPVAIRTELGTCPWLPEHQLLRIGLRARALVDGKLPPRNLTFLIDVSGSMNDARKLPLLKRALGLLVDHLTEQDRLAVVVYAGASGVALPPTRGDQHTVIHAALDALRSGGSTDGGEGIQLAYRIATEGVAPGVASRVILATDGDFNVGVSSRGELERLVEARRESGIGLTVLGFGMGNLKDSQMEALAAHANGNYAYIDSFPEARRVLLEDVAGTLITVAKDVKVQVELNPGRVHAYRLIGYENRQLRKEEFLDDRADAGDMGADQTVTALYEIVPAGLQTLAANPLRYQASAPLTAAASSSELAIVKLRYKDPEGHASRELVQPVDAAARPPERASADFRFAAGVAAFGMLLRESPFRGHADMRLVRSLISEGGAGDERRRELAVLVDRAAALASESGFER